MRGEYMKPWFKYYVKQSYKDRRWLSEKNRAYIDLFRPFTLIFPFIAASCVMLMAFSYYGIWPPDMLLISGIGLCMSALNGASNIINQVFDYEIDCVNKDYRPLPMGLISKKEALRLSLLIYVVVLVISVLVNPIFFWLVCGIVAITVSYSVPPFYLKRRLWANNITIALCRGYLGIIASWSVIAVPTPVMIHILGVTLAIYLVGSQSFKDLGPEKVGDAMFGVRTLPVVYGDERTLEISFSFMVGAMAFMVFTVWMGWLTSPFIWVPLVSLGVIMLMIKVGAKEYEKVENNVLWGLFYIDMMIFAGGSTVAVIVS